MPALVALLPAVGAALAPAASSSGLSSAELAACGTKGVRFPFPQRTVWLRTPNGAPGTESAAGDGHRRTATARSDR
jgi:small-conductance mechanosensitive channel